MYKFDKFMVSKTYDLYELFQSLDANTISRKLCLHMCTSRQFVNFK